MVLGVGAEWQYEYTLRADFTVLHYSYLAFGFHSSREAALDEHRSLRVLPWEEVPRKIQSQLLAHALGDGWQPTDARQRQAVLDHGMADALLDEQDRLGWTPPSLGSE
jgi:hypothetical protein